MEEIFFEVVGSEFEDSTSENSESDHDETDHDRISKGEFDDNTSFERGCAVYSAVATDRTLRELFRGNEDVVFLHPFYLDELDPSQQLDMLQWLENTANMATLPRLQTKSGRLHDDFRWLLENRYDRVLDLLRAHWDVYKPLMTDKIKQTLMEYAFPCLSGADVALQDTFLPLPTLLKASREYCQTSRCSFLVLTDAEPGAWDFLSFFRVGKRQNLKFYLWILKQPEFMTRTTIRGAKNLYLMIQDEGLGRESRDQVRYGETMSDYCKSCFTGRLQN
jgi:hypothetical protein